MSVSNSKRGIPNGLMTTAEFIRTNTKIALTHLQQLLLYKIGYKIGYNKQAWFKQDTLASELSLTRKCINENLRYFEKQKILKISKRKTHKGKQNIYSFGSACKIMGTIISVEMGEIKEEMVSKRTPKNQQVTKSPMSPQSYTPTPSMSPQSYTPTQKNSSQSLDTLGLQGNGISLKEYTKSKKNTERGKIPKKTVDNSQKSKASLSEKLMSFKPNQEQEAKAKEHEIDLGFVLAKFTEHMLSTNRPIHDTNKAFDIWLTREIKYEIKNKKSSPKNAQVQSNISSSSVNMRDYTGVSQRNKDEKASKSNFKPPSLAALVKSIVVGG